MLTRKAGKSAGEIFFLGYVPFPSLVIIISDCSWWQATRGSRPERV